MLNELVIASHNPKKSKEIEALLSCFSTRCRTLADFTAVSVEETGSSFIENALIKAKYAAEVTQLPALADDSGLVVPALAGAPGVYSARYAGEHASDADNNEKLLQALEGSANRAAYFVCVLVLSRTASDPLPLIAQGIWQGQIATTPSGDGGFGYDPLFIPDGHQQTAAALGAASKNQISHRALALQALKQQIERYY